MILEKGGKALIMQTIMNKTLKGKGYFKNSKNQKIITVSEFGEIYTAENIIDIKNINNTSRQNNITALITSPSFTYCLSSILKITFL